MSGGAGAIKDWDWVPEMGRYERVFGNLMGCVWDLGTGFWAGELRSPAGRLARVSCADAPTAARMVEMAARECAGGKGGA
jgi:hypothetical protein